LIRPLAMTDEIPITAASFEVRSSVIGGPRFLHTMALPMTFDG
jgi:hypothetical protein